MELQTLVDSYMVIIKHGKFDESLKAECEKFLELESRAQSLSRVQLFGTS